MESDKTWSWPGPKKICKGRSLKNKNCIPLKIVLICLYFTQISNKKPQNTSFGSQTGNMEAAMLKPEFSFQHGSLQGKGQNRLKSFFFSTVGHCYPMDR